MREKTALVVAIAGGPDSREFAKCFMRTVVFQARLSQPDVDLQARLRHVYDVFSSEVLGNRQFTRNRRSPGTSGEHPASQSSRELWHLVFVFRSETIHAGWYGSR